MDKKITENAYGKINLSLDITGRMTNGLHEVKTVMQTISLCDTVTLTCVRGANEIKISCDDKSVPCDERNTCYKATNVFFEKTGVTGYGIEIHIQEDTVNGRSRRRLLRCGGCHKDAQFSV